MNRGINYFILFFVLVLLTGCSGASFFELSSVDRNVDFYKGREIIERESSEASIYLNFEEQRGPYFVLYLEALNRSNNSILLDPSAVRMEVMEPKFGNQREENIFYAVDPEIMLEQLDREKSDLETSHSINQGLHGLLAVFDVVSDIANDQGDDAVKWGVVMQNEQVDYEVASNELLLNRQHWQNDVLRKTTIYEKDRFGGIVYVPCDKDAKLVKIIVPFGNKDYEFLFKQEEIN